MCLIILTSGASSVILRNHDANMECDVSSTTASSVEWASETRSAMAQCTTSTRPHDAMGQKRDCRGGGMAASLKMLMRMSTTRATSISCSAAMLRRAMLRRSLRRRRIFLRGLSCAGASNASSAPVVLVSCAALVSTANCVTRRNRYAKQSCRHSFHAPPTFPLPPLPLELDPAISLALALLEIWRLPLRKMATR